MAAGDLKYSNKYNTLKSTTKVALFIWLWITFL